MFFTSFSPSLKEAEAVSPNLGAALRLAVFSRELQPLMDQHGIRSHFSQVSSNGLCIVDSTQNPTNAYKIRGALASLSQAKLLGKGSVVTASAGNHGAGVARAAQLLGMKARVYVPVTAPRVKVEAIEKFGATVMEAGKSFDESLQHARLDEELREEKATFVHPFNDLVVAAGQGTIGLEILAHVKELRKRHQFENLRIFLPVGGGGLLAGVASTVKMFWEEKGIRPEIVGVMDESSPAALLGTLFGRPVAAAPDTIADGTKVSLIGETFLSVSHLVDHMMLVRHDSIVSAMRRYEQETLTRIEAAGALALAGEAQARNLGLFREGGATLSLALISGRNVDSGAFHEAVTGNARLNVSSHTRQAFDVRIPEREGELLRFLRAVKHFNIASLTYKQRPDAADGELRVEFEVPRADLSELHETISANFRGSRSLKEGQAMLYRVGQPVAREYHDQLLTLADRPGSFLDCVEKLTQSGSFGSVVFLFYRKPAHVGREAQVVLGLRGQLQH